MKVYPVACRVFFLTCGFALTGLISSCRSTIHGNGLAPDPLEQNWLLYTKAPQQTSSACAASLLMIFPRKLEVAHAKNGPCKKTGFESFAVTINRKPLLTAEDPHVVYGSMSGDTNTYVWVLWSGLNPNDPKSAKKSECLLWINKQQRVKAEELGRKGDLVYYKVRVRDVFPSSPSVPSRGEIERVRQRYANAAIAQGGNQKNGRP